MRAPRRRPRLVVSLSVLLLASAGAILASAGCSPAGFDPENGCAPLPGCEQCASRGGCGWCADTCVPVQGASCSTGLIQAPNLCPGATPPAASAAPAP